MTSNGLNSILKNLKNWKTLSLKEKMTIFGYVYALQEDEIPESISETLYIILNEYGADYTWYDEFDKQTFLNIYGEAKSKSYSLTQIEDIFDIVLSELAIRSSLTPIFPKEANDRQRLTPYTKANAVEYLAMKKLNIYSSSSFELDRLISNKEHINFPLTMDLLEFLMCMKEFEIASKEIFDLIKKALGHTQILRFKEVFIQWFNSFFWKEEFGQIEFAKDKALFNNVFVPFNKCVKVKLTINENHLSKDTTKIISILGGKSLSKIGREYLTNLYPFNLVSNKAIAFE